MCFFEKSIVFLTSSNSRLTFLWPNLASASPNAKCTIVFSLRIVGYARFGEFWTHFSRWWSRKRRSLSFFFSSLAEWEVVTHTHNMQKERRGENYRSAVKAFSYRGKRGRSRSGESLKIISPRPQNDVWERGDGGGKKGFFDNERGLVGLACPTRRKS